MTSANRCDHWISEEAVSDERGYKPCDACGDLVSPEVWPNRITRNLLRYGSTKVSPETPSGTPVQGADQGGGHKGHQGQGHLRQTAAGGRKLRVTRASQVKVRRQRWLWENWIVLGGLTLLAGREGLGKSTIIGGICAQVTLGQVDGEYKGEPRTVIYLHSEDARDTTIVPRLVAAGADLERVIFVDAVQADEDGEFESQVVLPMDVAAMADLAIEHDAALVILDAATSVIDSRLDGDKDRQMRKGLEAIARGIGERAGCAVVGVVHFGKRDSGDTGKLILGSIAWSQVARSVLAVAKDEESGNLVLSATKSNLAPGDAASLSARIVSCEVPTDDGAANVGRVEWLGETEQNARDLLAGPEPEGGRSQIDEAIEWLHDYLTGQGGSARAGDVIKAARVDGIAERTLQRAREKAGIPSAKGLGGWGWSLEGANVSNRLSSEDAKAPTDAHVQAPWRLGALASSDEATVHEFTARRRGGKS